MMKPCENCQTRHKTTHKTTHKTAKKQRKSDIMEAMDALEEALQPLRDVCRIMEKMPVEDRPLHYLCKRMATHTEDVAACFYAALDVALGD